jgi:hypothetical protein
VLSLICVVVLTGCAAGAFDRRGDVWRHAGAGFEVPDLTREGWRRLRLDGAQLAFEKNGEGVIALRVICDRSPRPLRWAGRDLWLGIPREDLVVREREIRGRPAVETAGRAEGTVVRAVIVENERCVVGAAHVRPGEQVDTGILDHFLDGLRFEEKP